MSQKTYKKNFDFNFLCQTAASIKGITQPIQPSFRMPHYWN